MSWLEKAKTDLTITCGDGETYTPLHIFTDKLVEYNVAQFEFPDLSGTLVKKSRPKGARYNLEIYFQGENHLDISQRFEVSAADSRHWVISHPYHGLINVQPLSLQFDYRSYNVTKVTGTIVETIIEEAPKGSLNPVDTILAKFNNTIDTLALQFVNDAELIVQDENTLADNNNKLYQSGKVLAKLQEESQGYFNAFNKANSAINNATAEPLAAIRFLQAVITAPFLFSANAKDRLSLLVNQFNTLRDTIATISSRTDKQIYENNTGSLVSTFAALTTQLRVGDFSSRNDVYTAIDTFIDTYDTYLADLDSLQSDNGGLEGAYIPNGNSQFALNDLMNTAISNLFLIALGSAQERIVILEDDSNAVLLANRFYGLEPDDSTIDKFIEQNNIGLKELLIIKKGRKISYYV